MNIFAQASRQRLRFHYEGVGSVDLEDLWAMPLTALDNLAQEENKKVKVSEDESFLRTTNKPKNTEALLKLEVLKVVINTLQDEAEERSKEKQIKEQKEELLELLALKKRAKKESLSEEELQKQIDAL